MAPRHPPPQRRVNPSGGRSSPIGLVGLWKSPEASTRRTIPSALASTLRDSSNAPLAPFHAREVSAGNPSEEEVDASHHRCARVLPSRRVRGSTSGAVHSGRVRRRLPRRESGRVGDRSIGALHRAADVRTFRLEPIIGWHHGSAEQTSNSSTSPNNGVSLASTDFLLGLGLFGTVHPGGAATLIYYGPRIGLAWTKQTLTDQSANSLTDKQKDWFLTFVVGGEHRISHFSVGGDAGLSYFKAGKPEFQQTGTAVFTTTDAGGWSIGTTASAFVRWYF
jgi:hypothetical protein